MKHIALSLLALTAGCAAPFGPPPADSPAVGALILHHSVTVPPEHARAFLQRGQSIAKRQLDEYLVNCNLEVRQVLEQPQEIQPGRFDVLSIQGLYGSVVRAGSLRLASAEDGGSPSMIHLGWHFWLRATGQPDLMRLTCRGELADPPDAQQPTLAEIASALGDIASLELYEVVSGPAPRP